jgi:hypothetical protein
MKTSSIVAGALLYLTAGVASLPTSLSGAKGLTAREETQIEESVRVRLEVEEGRREVEVEIDIEIDVVIDTRRELAFDPPTPLKKINITDLYTGHTQITEVFEAEIISVSEGLNYDDVYCNYYSDYSGKDYLGRFSKHSSNFGKHAKHIGSYKCSNGRSDKRDETEVEESVKIRVEVEEDDREVEIEVDIEIDVVIDTRSK